MSAITPNQANGNSNTSRTFLTALVVNVGLLVVEVGVFITLRTKLWRIYGPRTYLPPPDKRAQELPSGLWKWFPDLMFAPPEDIIKKNGLDAYMFLRFIKMLIWIFLGSTCLTFAVIIPVVASNVGNTQRGLERISWNNIIDPQDQPRFAAHVVVVYILTFFVICLIRREMLYFVHLRHQFLISKAHSGLAQARTVLITAVPDELASEKDLRTFASFVPGGVDRVWLVREHAILNGLFAMRQAACTKLEAAEVALLAKATITWRKRDKANRKARKLKPHDAENGVTEGAPHVASQEFLRELVPPSQWPKHRTGFLGCFGANVNTIEWCKGEIVRLNTRIKEERAALVDGKFLGSAFVRCNLQIGAHVLAQCVSYHEPMRMYDKWMEANPRDIVWKNLDDGALEMTSRYVISWLATIGLIVIWGFPSAFIGALSNLDDLCFRLRWLRWVCAAPNPLPGIIQGVLPPVLLAILFALLPFVLRGLAWYECIPRYSLISVSVYRRFFLFLLVHGFLIVTLSSGITKAIEGIISQPTQTVQELARQLPGASIFFLTYTITQGLAGAGGALAQAIPLILHYIRKWFLGRTPRQAYAVTFLMPSADFGVVLPRLSLLATIAFAYSVLSPLINFLALVSFSMFYIAWKFLLTQVFDQPDERETGGLYFPMAMSNLFVGLYIEQICLACLFFLKVEKNKNPAVIEGVFMVVLVVITLAAQLFLNYSFEPITNYLPMSLATKKMAKRFERKNQELEEAGVTVSDKEIDLFSRERIRSIRKRIKKTTKKLDDKLTILKSRVRRDSYDSESGAEEEPSRTQTASAQLPLEGAPELFRAVSNASKTSKKSRKSENAKPMDIPTIDPAAHAEDNVDGDDSDDDMDKHAFDHPSTYVDQPWIWLPHDNLGLSEVLTNDLRAVGIGASDVGAVMDEKAVVEVTRNPPDEEWYGGHDK